MGEEAAQATPPTVQKRCQPFANPQTQCPVYRTEGEYLQNPVVGAMAILQQSTSGPGPAVQCITSAPPFIGIKSNGVPLAFNTTHKRNRAGNANKFAGLMAFGRRREESVGS